MTGKRWIAATLLAATLLDAAGAPRAAMAAETAPPLPVRIVLRDDGFGFHNIAIRSQAFALTVRNAGKREHALAIMSRAQTEPLAVETRGLAPGASTTLILRLPPGSYEIFSPLGHDRDHGLAAPMQIMAAHPAASSGSETDRVFYNY